MTRTRTETGHEAGGRLFLNAAEVGRELGIRKSGVYVWAEEGPLPAVRLGRRV